MACLLSIVPNLQGNTIPNTAELSEIIEQNRTLGFAYLCCTFLSTKRLTNGGKAVTPSQMNMIGIWCFETTHIAAAEG